MKPSIHSLLAAVTVTTAIAASNYAQAGLIKLSDDLIYDDVSDITWLADLRYVKTSGINDDGKLTWAASMSWADELNAFGYSEWRLATVEEGLGLQYSATDFDLFNNTPSITAPFWSSTEDHSINADKAYLFKLDGNSGFPLKSGERFAWAVLDGNVKAASQESVNISEPATVALFGISLAFLLGRRNTGK